MNDHWLENLLAILVLSLGLAGPFIAAWRLGREAVASPDFRRRLLPCVALPLVAAVAAGWCFQADAYHVAAGVLAVLVVAALTLCALIATVAYRPGLPGRAGMDGVARSLWTLVLAGGVLYLSLPMGWGFQIRSVRTAKAWVEAAAAEVRAVEKATGRLPVNLHQVIERVGPPPRLVPVTGGYSVEDGGATFRFIVDDPGAFLGGWYIYEGATGAWTQEVD